MKQTDKFKPYLKPNRRIEELRREQGLCFRCGAEKRNDRSRCNKCLNDDKVDHLKRVQKRKVSGLCTVCGKPLTEIDKGFKNHNRNDCAPSRRSS